MRRLTVVLVAAVVAAASCSSGSSGDGEPEPTSSSEIPPILDAPESTAPPTTDVAPNPSIPAPPGDSAYEQLEALRTTGSELEVALAEFAAITGPLPGTPQLIDDGTIYPSLTHVLDEIEAQRSELTPEQADAIDARLAEIFDPEVMVDEFALFEDVAGDADAENEAEPEGFAPRGMMRGGATLRTDTPLDEAPDPYQGVIRAAGEALRSRLGGPPLNIWVQLFEPGTFGTAAGRNVGLDLTDFRRDELPTGPDCLMQLTTGPLPADIVGIVTHEIVHCWQFTRMGFEPARQNAMDDWAKEGMAAYFGEEVGGLTRFNAEWWGGYLTTRVDADGEWDTYARSYDAIGFWSRVARGGDIVAAMRRTIDASPSNSAMFRAATSDLGADVNWLGAGTFERADWGGPWTGSGPGSPGTPRRTAQHTVIERNDIAVSAEAGAQSNHEIDVSPVSGADGSVLTIAGTGNGGVRLDPDDVALGGSFVEEWCLGSCVCPDDSPAFPEDRIKPGAVEVAISLVGQPSEATILRARVEAFDAEESERCDEDEEEEPEPSPEPSGDLGGLVGTWVASPESVAAVFEQASAFGAGEAALDVAGAAGDVLLTFAEGGTGTLVYDSVTLFLNDEVIGDLTITGEGTFNWAIVSGSVQISGTTFAFSVGSSALGGELLTLTDADVPNVGTTTLSGGVSDGALIFSSADGSAGRVFFPASWTRQS